MTKQIGNYSIRQGTDGNDVNFSITPGVAYFAAGGDDTLWTKGSAQLPLGGLNWWVPSIASGGNGNDKYYVEFGSSTFIADASNSNADLLTVYDYLSKIKDFFSIDKRHIFISTSFGTNILLIDALNVFGAIETIKFLDVELSGASNSIGSLLSNYQTELDQSFESLINGGYFNPMVMGVTGASEVRGIINMLTEFSLAEPTYILAPSVTTINEGSTLTTSVATTNVASGTTLHYSLSGAGITAADFSAGALIGSVAVGDDGKVSISHTLKNDLTTEGAESLEIKLFSDTARTVQVGSTAMVSVVDSSTTPVPTYMLTPSAATINEGAVLTSTVATTNVATGTKYYYALSGTEITTADFSAGALTGEGITDSAGKFTFTHTLANDLTTKGAETLSINLYSDVARTVQVGATATVSVVDSSTTPAPTYTVTPSLATINEGAVLTSTVATTNLATGTTLYYALSGTGITAADFAAGALTGQVTTGTNGSATFAHTLASDLTTEGPETLQIKLFSDSSRTIQVGDIASVTIADTSTALASTFISTSAANVAEGHPVIIDILADYFPVGAKIYYGLSGVGIVEEDFSSGNLTGEFSIQSKYGHFSLLYTIANDLKTEGIETIEFKLFSDDIRSAQIGSTAYIAIADTSTSLGSADAGRQRLGDIRSAILKENIYANAYDDFSKALLGSSGSDFIVATKSNQFISGIGFDTNTKNYPGVIDVIDAGAADIYNLTFLIDGINGNLPSIDGDKGFTVIKNFKAGSDDLVLSKARSYVLAGRSIATNDGKVYSGTGVHIDTNNSKHYDSRDELIALLEYADRLSASRGNLVANTTSFGGRVIYIEVPNNTPTGTPTLSGNFKAGQVITIDKIPIQDADNFTGYTPDFKYAWEVSFNGTTWTTLTTTDATDNNTTYTLTTAEVGKQIRGVVGYLDGYGTNEVVNSAASESIANVTPSYILTPSAATINEGAVLTSTVATTNVTTGTKLYYALSGTGITTADFSAGALKGDGSTDATGKFTFSHTLANDLTTEGAETLSIKLFSDDARTLQVGATASLSIVDTSIKTKSFNLDVDGDGKITALGDGLMVIRKLFGAAFAGDALTNKAMSPTSTRTSAEIHEFIQQGLTSGLLDVDKDGKTTALGDGLMVIRHLFGAAFADGALTNKAISPASPYFGPPINHAAVATNIDALKIL